jgi:hypothetical protein
VGQVSSADPAERGCGCAVVVGAVALEHGELWRSAEQDHVGDAHRDLGRCLLSHHGDAAGDLGRAQRREEGLIDAHHPGVWCQLGVQQT